MPVAAAVPLLADRRSPSTGSPVAKKFKSVTASFDLNPMPQRSVRQQPGKSSAPKMSGKSLNDLVGQSLGHFKLDRILHTGGTSVLFQATDEQKSRPAVVKVMLPSITADEEQRSRFVRAVHTMINVRHDNLVEIYGAGKQGPFCWCAMEYVDGISILETIEMIGVEGPARLARGLSRGGTRGTCT